MSRPVYLVVEPIEVIAADLAMNVQDYDPSAMVIIALSPQAGCTALKDCASVRLAFVHADPTVFSKTDLAHVLQDFGAQVVFIGDAAERQDAGILVLQRPFSSETTAAILLRAETSERA